MLLVQVFHYLGVVRQSICNALRSQFIYSAKVFNPLANLSQPTTGAHFGGAHMTRLYAGGAPFVKYKPLCMIVDAKPQPC